MNGRTLGLVLLLWLTACTSAGRGPESDPFRYGLWPFYSADARPWAGVRESRALGPFVHWQESGETRELELRPFYAALRTPTQRSDDWLFPVANCREHPMRHVCALVLLAGLREDSVQKTSWVHLGFAFWGKTSDGQHYGGLFPFGGVFRERFGFDRIEFLLWPFFARGHKGAYTETQLLWPFLAWGSGDGRSRLRIWPLYGKSVRKGVYRHRFWLWPFVHLRADRLDAPHPIYTALVLPFYGRRDAAAQASRFYFFPFYLHQWDREDPKTERRDFFWPFYTRARHSDGSEIFAIRPFWSRTKRADEQKISFLLGLVGRRDFHDKSLRERSWTLFWAGRTTTRAEGGRELHKRDLWPLYRSRRVKEADGTRHGFVRIPFLFPMRGLEPDGWNRNYNQIFELYGKRWVGEQERSSWLFGLRETRRSPESSWESWLGLIHRGHVNARNPQVGGSTSILDP